MSPSTNSGHRNQVIEQFSRQAAIPFAEVPAITNEGSLKLLVELSRAGKEDTVLDLACGAGLVVCAFAEIVRHATGMDLTPAMIERAQALQQQKGLGNVSWKIGDVAPLSFAAASFSIIVSRYAFHHFPNPPAVMAEMARVCQPGGKVLLVDVYTSADPEKAAAYNCVEKLRDPSHVRAMPLAELERLVREAGLQHQQTLLYGLEMEVEQLLRVSFPNPGDADQIRQIFVEELKRPRMEVGAKRKGSAIHFTYPIAVVVAEKRS